MKTLRAQPVRVAGTTPEDLLLGAEQALRDGNVRAAEIRVADFQSWLARGGALTGLLADWFTTVEGALEVARG